MNFFFLLNDFDNVFYILKIGIGGQDCSIEELYRRLHEKEDQYHHFSKYNEMEISGLEQRVSDGNKNVESMEHKMKSLVRTTRAKEAIVKDDTEFNSIYIYIVFFVLFHFVLFYFLKYNII